MHIRLTFLIMSRLLVGDSLSLTECSLLCRRGADMDIRKVNVHLLSSEKMDVH